jgi:type VI protein secretion system component VasF
MAVRGAAASRRRLRNRVAIVGFVAGLVVGAVLALLGGGSAIDAVLTGVFVGALVAVIGAIVVALLPTSSHGPPGQH